MIIFDHQPIRYFPITFTRPVSDLRCGILKLRQRLQALIDDSGTHLWIQPRLEELYQERHPDWMINKAGKAGELMVNSSLIPSPEHIAAVKNLKAGELIRQDQTIVAIRLLDGLEYTSELLPAAFSEYRDVEGINMLFTQLADLVHANEGLIRQDYENFFYDKDNTFELEPGVTVLNPYSVWLGEGVTLKPGVILDASEGPIVIDEGATVMPNAVILGPCYIGKNSQIKVAAKIYQGTSIGPVCKVGGEVEGTIFQAYSNKQHDGFLGHAYVGEWVNIGADTNNSDLKNTYDSVSVYNYEEGAKTDSGTMFMGCIIGDHSKLGINCTINTGTVIGVGANLWGSPLIDTFIPDFSWGMANELRPYRLQAFFWTANEVKQRRKLQLSAAEKELYREIAEASHGD